jgi:hypothetical protein
MFNKSIVKLVRQAAEKWHTDLELPFEKVLPATVVVVAAALEGVVFRDRYFSPGGHAVGLSGAGLE